MAAVAAQRILYVMHEHQPPWNPDPPPDDEMETEEIRGSDEVEPAFNAGWLERLGFGPLAGVPADVRRCLEGSPRDWHIEVSPDGGAAAVLTDDALELRLAGESGGAESTALIPRASGFSEARVLLERLRDANPAYRRLAWSSDSRLVAASLSTGAVFLAERDGGRAAVLHPRATGARGPLAGLAVLPLLDGDGTAEALLLSFDGTLRLVRARLSGEAPLPPPESSEGEGEAKTAAAAGAAGGKAATKKKNKGDSGAGAEVLCAVGAVRSGALQRAACLAYDARTRLAVVGGARVFGHSDEEVASGSVLHEGPAPWVAAWSAARRRAAAAAAAHGAGADKARGAPGRTGRAGSRRALRAADPAATLWELSVGGEGGAAAGLDTEGGLWLWDLRAGALARRRLPAPSFSPLEEGAAAEDGEAADPPARVRWWGPSALLVGHRSGAYAVYSLPAMRNLLGDAPERFPRGTAGAGLVAGRALFLELERRRLVRGEAAAPEEEEEAGEGSSGLRAAVGRLASRAARAAAGRAAGAIRWYLRGGEEPQTILRTYRLVSICPVSPQAYFTVKVEAGEYGTALALANTYGLNPDSVYKRRFQSAPVDRHNLADNLEKVKDRHWALGACLDRIGETASEQRLLLSYVIRHTDVRRARRGGGPAPSPVPGGPAPAPPPALGAPDEPLDPESVTEEEAAILRLRLRALEYSDRLDTYVAVCGSEERYDAEGYRRFRTEEPMRAARARARAEDFRAVAVLFERHRAEIGPRGRLEVLRRVPATADPSRMPSYARLLPRLHPSLGTPGFDDDPEDEEEEEEGSSSARRAPDFAEAPALRARLGVGAGAPAAAPADKKRKHPPKASPHAKASAPAAAAAVVDSRPLTVEDVVGCPFIALSSYAARAEEVEAASGLPDVALGLVRAALDRRGLRAASAGPGGAAARALAALEADLADLTAALYAVRPGGPSQAARGPEGLRLAAAVAAASSADLPEPERLIPTDVALLRAALACARACRGVGPACLAALHDIFVDGLPPLPPASFSLPLPLRPALPPSLQRRPPSALPPPPAPPALPPPPSLLRWGQSLPKRDSHREELDPELRALQDEADRFDASLTAAETLANYGVERSVGALMAGAGEEADVADARAVVTLIARKSCKDAGSSDRRVREELLRDLDALQAGAYAPLLPPHFARSELLAALLDARRFRLARELLLGPSGPSSLAGRAAADAAVRGAAAAGSVAAAAASLAGRAATAVAVPSAATHAVRGAAASVAHAVREAAASSREAAAHAAAQTAAVVAPSGSVAASVAHAVAGAAAGAAAAALSAARTARAAARPPSSLAKAPQRFLPPEVGHGVALAAARALFNSAASHHDPALDDARACLELAPESEEAGAELRLLEALRPLLAWPSVAGDGDRAVALCGANAAEQYGPAWRTCARLAARGDLLPRPADRARLLGFAAAHCPPAELGPLLEAWRAADVLASAAALGAPVPAADAASAQGLADAAAAALAALSRAAGERTEVRAGRAWTGTGGPARPPRTPASWAGPVSAPRPSSAPPAPPPPPHPPPTGVAGGRRAAGRRGGPQRRGPRPVPRRRVAPGPEDPSAALFVEGARAALRASGGAALPPGCIQSLTPPPSPAGPRPSSSPAAAPPPPPPPPERSQRRRRRRRRPRRPPRAARWMRRPRSAFAASEGIVAVDVPRFASDREYQRSVLLELARSGDPGRLASALALCARCALPTWQVRMAHLEGLLAGAGGPWGDTHKAALAEGERELLQRPAALARRLAARALPALPGADHARLGAALRLLADALRAASASASAAPALAPHAAAFAAHLEHLEKLSRGSPTLDYPAFAGLPLSLASLPLPAPGPDEEKEEAVPPPPAPSPEAAWRAAVEAAAAAASDGTVGMLAKFLPRMGPFASRSASEAQSAVFGAYLARLLTRSDPPPAPARVEELAARFGEKLAPEDAAALAELVAGEARVDLGILGAVPGGCLDLDSAQAVLTRLSRAAAAAGAPTEEGAEAAAPAKGKGKGKSKAEAAAPAAQAAQTAAAGPAGRVERARKGVALLAAAAAELPAAVPAAGAAAALAVAARLRAAVAPGPRWRRGLRRGPARGGAGGAAPRALRALLRGGRRLAGGVEAALAAAAPLSEAEEEELDDAAAAAERAERAALQAALAKAVRAFAASPAPDLEGAELRADLLQSLARHSARWAGAGAGAAASAAGAPGGSAQGGGGDDDAAAALELRTRAAVARAFPSVPVAPGEATTAEGRRALFERCAAAAAGGAARGVFVRAQSAARVLGGGAGGARGAGDWRRVLALRDRGARSALAPEEEAAVSAPLRAASALAAGYFGAVSPDAAAAGDALAALAAAYGGGGDAALEAAVVDAALGRACCPASPPARPSSPPPAPPPPPPTRATRPRCGPSRPSGPTRATGWR
eukprot:tig00000076_g2431.t1